MNEQLKSKYELLGRYKAKMKLSPGAKMEAQEIFDQEAKLSETFYNIDENLLAKCAFYRLGHTKVPFFILIGIFRTNLKYHCN